MTNFNSQKNERHSLFVADSSPALPLKPKLIESLMEDYLAEFKTDFPQAKELIWDQKTKNLFCQKNWANGQTELKKAVFDWAMDKLNTAEDFFNVDSTLHDQLFYREQCLKTWIDQGLGLTDVEKNYICAVMNFSEQNISKAARILKISRKTLYAKLKRYQLD